MPPRSAESSLDGLAPDQRAALELVLRRGLSYAELSSLLGIAEPVVRERARCALEALAPDTPPPAASGRVADWLLGQQVDAEARETRALLSDDARTRAWAAAVSAPLRPLGGERVPEVPAPTTAPRPRPLRDRRPEGEAARDRAGHEKAAPDRAGHEKVARERAGRDEPARDRAEPPRDDVAPEEAAGVAAAGGLAASGRSAAPEPAASGRRAGAAPAGSVPQVASSRLGGAVLLGVVGLLAAGLLVWLLAFRGGDDTQPRAAAPVATATPPATSQQTGNDIVLRSPNGAQAAGLMRLFKAGDGTVRFLLAGQGLPPNAGRELYSIWFTRRGVPPRLLGYVRTQVKQDGQLATGGPQTADVARFPRWFATYDDVLITRDRGLRKTPGRVLLRGTLPHGEANGG